MSKQTEQIEGDDYFAAFLEFLKSMDIDLDVTPVEYATNKHFYRDSWAEKEGFFYGAWSIQQKKVDEMFEIIHASLIGFTNEDHMDKNGKIYETGPFSELAKFLNKNLSARLVTE